MTGRFPKVPVSAPETLINSKTAVMSPAICLAARQRLYANAMVPFRLGLCVINLRDSLPQSKVGDTTYEKILLPW